MAGLGAGPEGGCPTAARIVAHAPGDTAMSSTFDSRGWCVTCRSCLGRESKPMVSGSVPHRRGCCFCLKAAASRSGPSLEERHEIAVAVTEGELACAPMLGFQRGVWVDESR